MANQPTATSLTRTQESWAKHLIKKIEADIFEREAYLQNERGFKPEDLDKDQELLDMYDDVFFYKRYAEEMKKQRAYIRETYGVGSGG